MSGWVGGRNLGKNQEEEQDIFSGLTSDIAV